MTNLDPRLTVFAEVIVDLGYMTCRFEDATVERTLDGVRVCTGTLTHGFDRDAPVVTVDRNGARSFV